MNVALEEFKKIYKATSPKNSVVADETTILFDMASFAQAVTVAKQVWEHETAKRCHSIAKLHVDYDNGGNSVKIVASLNRMVEVKKRGLAALCQ